MKKMILLSLSCMLISTPILFSQNKDSLAQRSEMERLKRLGDSLHREQLARDSAFNELMNGSLQKVEDEIAESKQKEVERATQEVLERHEKQQRAQRRTMWLALSAFVITIVLARMIFKRKKQKDDLPN